MASMVGITMATELSTIDFVNQMRGFQASDDARQKLFAVRLFCRLAMIHLTGIAFA